MLKLYSKLKVSCGSIRVFSHSETVAEAVVLILAILFSWCNNARKMQELADICNYFESFCLDVVCIRPMHMPLAEANHSHA